MSEDDYEIEERAAIMEYDANIERTRAEKLARLDDWRREAWKRRKTKEAEPK